MRHSTSGRKKVDSERLSLSNYRFTYAPLDVRTIQKKKICYSQQQITLLQSLSQKQKNREYLRGLQYKYMKTQQM